MSKLLELAELCERATARTRQLDRDIALAVLGPEKNPISATEHAFCAAYTASLDAAMTLVPEGFLMAITNAGTSDPREPDFSRASAVCDDWRSTESGAVEAATPALALCAAALRARAHLEDQSKAAGA